MAGFKCIVVGDYSVGMKWINLLFPLNTLRDFLLGKTSLLAKYFKNEYPDYPNQQVGTIFFGYILIEFI